MARIKKKGLDYFPMGVDFVGSREVRRLVKREGEGAYMVLSFLISDLYGAEGYYLSVDEDYYEDLSDRLFTMETEDVRRIVIYTVELGLFDARLYKEYGILTSVDIQRQYLFSTKRRSCTGIDENYCLIAEDTPANPPADSQTDATPVEEVNATEKGINVTETAEKYTSTVPGYTKHSIAKHSIAKHNSSSTGSSKPVKEWTKEDIDCLEPPADGQKRNFEGLKENLRLFHIPIPEQYAIICKTSYGLIGHPVWKGFVELRNKFGKFHSPGRFLLKQST